MAEESKKDRRIDALTAMAGGGRRGEADLASAVESAARDESDVDISGEIAAIEDGSTADIPAMAGAATGNPMSAADAAEAAEAAVGIGPAVDPVLAAPAAALDADGPDQIALEARLAEAAARPAPAADGLTAASQRRAEYDARRRTALAMQFRKTMIPVIVMVAVILILLAGGLLMVVSPLVTGRVGEESTLGWIAASPLVQAHGKALAITSLAVAGVLLAGSWKFQRDVRRCQGR